MFTQLSRTQKLSLIVGVISAFGGLITQIGQTWGFTAIAGQISETCFAFSGFCNIIFFGITVQKAKEGTVFESKDTEKLEEAKDTKEAKEETDDKGKK